MSQGTILVGPQRDLQNFIGFSRCHMPRLKAGSNQQKPADGTTKVVP
jgi:hypothetical protein